VKRLMVLFCVIALLMEGCSAPATPDASQVARQVEASVAATVAAQAAQAAATSPAPAVTTAPVPATATQPAQTAAAPTAKPTAAPTATSAPTAAPTATSTATATPVPGISSDKAVNLRSGPGTGYPQVGTTKPGETYAVQSQTSDGSWLEVCCVEQKPVWVAAELVKAQGNIKTVQIAKNIPTPPPSPTAAPTKPVPPSATPVPAKPMAGIHSRQTIGTWEIQVERVHKEKAVYWYGDSTVAMGNYAIVIVLAKNLASGTQDMNRTLMPRLKDQLGRIYKYSSPYTAARTAGASATWEFSVNPTIFTNINPNVETPLLMLWDVNQDVANLHLLIEDDNDNIVEWNLGDFANIPPFKK
jgi:uncharacterized protein YraI